MEALSFHPAQLWLLGRRRVGTEEGGSSWALKYNQQRPFPSLFPTAPLRPCPCLGYRAAHHPQPVAIGSAAIPQSPPVPGSRQVQWWWRCLVLPIRLCVGRSVSHGQALETALPWLIASSRQS